MTPGFRAILVAAIACAAAPIALAQAPSGAPMGVDCRAVAAQSGGRMTQAQCEQQFGAISAMQQAMSQPGGERPGDDAMSCDQIAAELRATPSAGVSREHAAEGVAAAKDYQAKRDKIQAEASAAAASQTAVNVGAAAAGTVVGNAASGAAMASQAATQEAISARSRQELDPAIARMQAANANSMGDVTRMMNANPRTGRLIGLAAAKNCRIN